jgi:hypothetical protein
MRFSKNFTSGLAITDNIHPITKGKKNTIMRGTI